MKHVLIRDSSLQGKEYGTLRSFEDAIIREAGASVIELPQYRVPSTYMKHFSHGMNRSKYRKYFPTQNFNCSGDVLWCVLMGPENYQLDLFKGWENSCKTKILYLFDTLPAQYPLIKKLFSNNKWDILITSFNDAVEDLQQLTGRKWYTVEQATNLSFFRPVPFQERVIAFSAFGRRESLVHEAVKKYCAAKNLYYEYTMASSWEDNIDGLELYRQYAWHLNHSLFTFSWPVEITNPQRAGHLRPITCRWFEAAAAGTIMVGKAPDNFLFENILFNDAVQSFEITTEEDKLFSQLDMLWEKREMFHQHAVRAQEEFSYRWSWDERVRSILKLLN